jgi:hypothetical protein
LPVHAHSQPTAKRTSLRHVQPHKTSRRNRWRNFVLNGQFPYRRTGLKPTKSEKYNAWFWRTWEGGQANCLSILERFRQWLWSWIVECKDNIELWGLRKSHQGG